MTNIVGTSAAISTRTVVSRSRRLRARSTMKADSDRISSTLPSSEA